MYTHDVSPAGVRWQKDETYTKSSFSINERTQLRILRTTCGKQDFIEQSQDKKKAYL